MINKFGKAKKGRGKSPRTHRHRAGFPFIVRSLIEEADILVEVLNARFIEKTRNRELEEKIKDSGKKIIFVLNKSDLADINKINLDGEIQELKPRLFFSSVKRTGAAALRTMIKTEAEKLKKDIVNIGVIGYPNTGKSSLINTLVGRKVSKTSSDSGHTKGVQKVKISEGIYLIDTPGIMPGEERFGSNKILAKHAKIGAVTWHKAKDPEIIVFEIMKEFPGIISEHYGLGSLEDSEILIEKLGQKMNYLRKGGEIDEIRVARKILRDWQEGKISF